MLIPFVNCVKDSERLLTNFSLFLQILSFRLPLNRIRPIKWIWNCSSVVVVHEKQNLSSSRCSCHGLLVKGTKKMLGVQRTGPLKLSQRNALTTPDPVSAAEGPNGTSITWIKIWLPTDLSKNTLMHSLIMCRFILDKTLHQCPRSFDTPRWITGDHPSHVLQSLQQVPAHGCGFIQSIIWF